MKKRAQAILEGILEDTCSITKDLGTCENPQDHRYMASTSVVKNLNDICALSKITPTQKQVDDALQSLYDMKRNMADCGNDKKKYPYQGNLFSELDELAFAGLHYYQK